jgi:hypothetical protein
MEQDRSPDSLVNVALYRDTPLFRFPQNGAFSETFDSRFVLLSELSTKIGGRGNAGLMESEENIKPFPTLPTVLGNHQRTVITTFPPHDDGYGLILTFLSGTQ